MSKRTPFDRRVSFKCLRANSCKIYGCFKRLRGRCEGAKMQIASSRRERERERNGGSGGRGNDRGLYYAIHLSLVKIDRPKFVHGVKSAGGY